MLFRYGGLVEVSAGAGLHNSVSEGHDKKAPFIRTALVEDHRADDLPTLHVRHEAGHLRGLASVSPGCGGVGPHKAPERRRNRNAAQKTICMVRLDKHPRSHPLNALQHRLYPADLRRMHPGHTSMAGRLKPAMCRRTAGQTVFVYAQRGTVVHRLSTTT